MKKLFTIISAGVALLLAASCTMKEQLVVLDPTQCTAPVVNSIEPADDGIVVTFEPGKLNVAAPVYHALAMVELAGKAVNVPLNSVEKEGELSITNESISKTLSGYGYVDGDVVDFKMVVRASAQQKQTGNHTGYVDASQIIPVEGFTVTLPQGSPYAGFDDVSDWSLIGAISAYGINWDGDLCMWTNGTGHVAAHVTLKAGDEVKFRKDQAWAVNMGGDFASLDTEFAVTQDGSNIKIDKDGVYDLYLYPEAGKAMVTEAFDPYPDFTETSTWSVIGSIASFDTSWGKDFPMATNGTVSVALGITLADSDEFKFRKDAGWAVNLGGSFEALGAEFAVTQDGSNIKPGLKGAYDAFVNPDAGTAWINEACGLKVSSIIGGDEPEPEPEKITGWNIIGLNGDWDNDVKATNSGNVWSAIIEAKEATEFKWRKDGDWAEDYGGEMVALGQPFEAVAGGSNIKLSAAGLYLVVLDLDALTITVSEANVFSLIGEINGSSWDKDFDLVEKNGVWVSEVVKISGGFKIRHNYSWDASNTYGAESTVFVATPGEPFVAIQPGENINLPEAGDYKVIFNPDTREVTINSVAFPEHLYMIGEEFGGWDWGSDGVVEMTPVLHNPAWGAEAEGQFYTVRYFSANKGFKFCAQRAWSGDFWGLVNNDGFVEAGGNCTVTEDGFYLVHIDFKNEKVHVEPAKVYGIGDAFGGWDEAVEANLFVAEGNTLTAVAPKAGKLRMYVASQIATSGWWTREFNIIDGAIVPRIMDELSAPDVKAEQVITLNFNEGTGSITGEGAGPSYKNVLSVPGSWSVWSEDAPKLAGNEQGQFAGPLKMAGEGIEFKFIHDGGWIGGVAGEEELTYVLGASDNMSIAAGTYWWNVDLVEGTAKATPITKVGIIGSFNEWSTDVELTAGEDDAFNGEVTLGANAEFKIRFNGSWDLALGGTLDAPTPYADNIKVADAGTYMVTVYLNHGKIILSPKNN